MISGVAGGAGRTSGGVGGPDTALPPWQPPSTLEAPPRQQNFVPPAPPTPVQPPLPSGSPPPSPVPLMEAEQQSGGGNMLKGGWMEA